MKNLVKIIASLLLVLTSFSVAAQTTPLDVDYDAIRKVVNEDPNLFRALSARFADADTSLTPEEIAIVYYGQAFTPAYNPDENYSEVMDAFNAQDMNLTITLADEALRRNPVSLPMLFKLYGCCATSEVPQLRDRAKGILDRIFMICDMATSTGLGVAPESPWKVISEADMNEILTKYLQVAREFDRSDLGDTKAVKVKIDGIDPEVILYFDLSLPHHK